jgi:putative DNA primase/helicase
MMTEQHKSQLAGYDNVHQAQPQDKYPEVATPDSATSQPGSPARQVDPIPIHLWANVLVGAGYPVFPIPNNEKGATLNQWPERASTDPDAFQEHWLANPNANIAIYCKGLVVIDIDVAKGGKASGYDWLAKLRLLVGDDVLMGCQFVLTPHLGLHIYFRCPAGVNVRNSVSKIAQSVDVRAENGYVLAPGSTVDGVGYTPLAITPDRLSILETQGEDALAKVRTWANGKVVHVISLPEAPPALLQRLQASPSLAGIPSGTVKPIKRPDTPLPEDQEALTKALSEQIGAKTFDPENHDDWFKVMAAGAHAVVCWRWDEDKTRQTIFDCFSKLSTKFDEAKNLKKWGLTMKRAASDDVDNPFTLRSVFYGTSVLPNAPDVTGNAAITSGSPENATDNAPTVIALGNETESSGWSKLVRLTNPNGIGVEIELQMADFDGAGCPWLTVLRGAGFAGAHNLKDKNALKKSILAANPTARYQRVATIGWHSCEFFLPGILNDRPTHFRLIKPPAQNVYAQAGTPQNWQQNVAAHCEPHDRLVSAICISLMGPLLKLFNSDGVIFHYFGPSTSGKTTALFVACTLWGNPNTYMRSWRTTDNGLETLVQTLNDTFLGLDELSQCSPKAAEALSYMTSNGQGKTRSTRGASAKAIGTWNIAALSTGEVPLEDKVKEGQQARHMAGMDVRMIDIPVDAGNGFGIFNDLGGANPAELADTLKAAAAGNYGHAGPAFILKLMELVKTDDGLVNLRKYHAQCKADLLPDSVESQVERVASRFALAALAGEYAILWGILPWQQGVPQSAAKVAFNAWLSNRGTSGNLETDRALGILSDYIKLYLSSQFEKIDKQGRRLSNCVHGICAGYYRDGDDGGTEVLIHTSIMHSKIALGVNKKACPPSALMGLI